MRIVRALFGLVCLGVTIASLIAPPAAAQDWCGFRQKAGARVQCGYSSLQKCEQALSDQGADKKDAAATTVTCVPDPSSG